MCGFTGFAGYINNPIKKLNVCNKLLEHRGPDMSDIYFSQKDNIGFAHNRLSIIDTTKNAIQPFKDKIGNILVFNGEIYNCLQLKKQLNKNNVINWLSSSDTEVLFNLLKYYGVKETLKMLEGMFAFSFFEKKSNSIFLARDIAGEKPLYFIQNNSEFIYSSETKPIRYLLNNNISISNEILSNHIYLNFNISGNTIFKNIISLKPGTFLKYNIKNNELLLGEHWNYEKKYSIINSKINKKNKKLELILEEEIKKQLISDVPVGTFMSGGLDSTLITSIASKHNKNMEIYSLGYEDNSYDESMKAERIASYLSLNFNRVIFKPEHLPNLFKEFISKLDLPHTDQSDLALYRLSKEAKKKTKVILTGDGGDELFAGYNRHIWMNKILKMNTFLRYILKLSFDNLYLEKILHKLNLLLPKKYQQLDFDSKLNKFQKILLTRNLRQLYLSLVNKDNKNYIYSNLSFNNKMSDLRNMMKYDFELFLPYNVLYKSDCCSMYNSIEIRSPFLSKNIIEQSFTLKDEDIVNKTQGKMILRKILKNYIPQSLIYSKKSGFSVPLSRWLTNELKDWGMSMFFDSVLKDKFSANINYKNLWDEFIENPDKNFQQIWNIIIVNSWLRENFNY